MTRNEYYFEFNGPRELIEPIARELDDIVVSIGFEHEPSVKIGYPFFEDFGEEFNPYKTFTDIFIKTGVKNPLKKYEAELSSAVYRYTMDICDEETGLAELRRYNRIIRDLTSQESIDEVNSIIAQNFSETELGKICELPKEYFLLQDVELLGQSGKDRFLDARVYSKIPHSRGEVCIYPLVILSYLFATKEQYKDIFGLKPDGVSYEDGRRFVIDSFLHGMVHNEIASRALPLKIDMLYREKGVSAFSKVLRGKLPFDQKVLKAHLGKEWNRTAMESSNIHKLEEALAGVIGKKDMFCTSFSDEEKRDVSLLVNEIEEIKNLKNIEDKILLEMAVDSIDDAFAIKTDAAELYLSRLKGI